MPPRDTFYYDCLEVGPQATSGDVRKAYYRLAMRCHPDKNMDASPAEKAAMETRFKQVNDAYQVLSDPAKRALYDERGREAVVGSSQFMDPREVFKQVFGGDAFVDIIGELSFVQLLEDAMAEAEASQAANRIGDAGSRPSHEQQEQMRRQRVLRVGHLATRLIDKLALYVDGNYSRSDFAEYCHREARNLSQESFGPELLHSVGYVYAMRAKQFMGKDSLLGLSSIYHSIKEKGHIVSQLYSTVSAVREVVADEQRQRLQQQQAVSGASTEQAPAAASVDEVKVRNLMWQMASLEVESVLRDVCDAVLAPSRFARRRAEALKILGDAYRRFNKQPQ